MRKITFICIATLLLAFAFLPPALANSNTPEADTLVTLVTPNPSPEAVALYRYLQDMKGKRTLSGQMWAPWGLNEITYLENNTGKLPALLGGDFIHESSNQNEVDKAVDWWRRGGVPSIMWHWGAPGIGEGYPNSQIEIDIDRCFEEGTDEYNDFWTELERKADWLEQLSDSSVPVLWRPYHEFDGAWFWYGMGGEEQFIRLWHTMFNYFVHERELNNLIWVLCYTGNPREEWYPGDEYVDIIAADTYDGGESPQVSMYNKVKEIANDQYPIAYHECGTPPNPDRTLLYDVVWAWWMIWHTNWLTDNDTEYLDFVFNHDLVVTLDEVPDIMALYNWPDSCTASNITPWVKVDSGDWINDNKVDDDAGTNVTFYPQVTDTGTWHWSGYSTSGSDTTQTVDIGERGTATAVFTNTCGASSSMTFHIAMPCYPTEIIPYAKPGDRMWDNTNEIEILEGESIALSPHPTITRGWTWEGCGITSDTRSLTITPDASCQITVTFTNDCGTTSSLVHTISIVDSLVSAPQNPLDLGLSLYPVPCKESLRVELTGQTNYPQSVISVYSLQGVQLIREYTDQTMLTLDTSKLSPGMYIVSVENGTTKKSVRFVRSK